MTFGSRGVKNLDVWSLRRATTLAGSCLPGYTMAGVLLGEDQVAAKRSTSRPFPDVNAQKWTVSTAGGWSPVWSPDGRELFYMNGGAMMAVAIEVQGTRFVTGKPQFLFDGPFGLKDTGHEF